MKTQLFFYKSGIILIVLAFVFGIWGCSHPSESTTPLTAAEKQKEAKLDQLFTELKHTEDPEQTLALQAKIWEIWMISEEQEVNQLMLQGIEAMASEEFDEAIGYFTKVTELKPSYPEAWNKRATLLFMMGNLESALQDIEKTLVLESRHFGALSGLAAIYLAEGKESQALKTYERIARIAPAEPHVQEQIQHLRGKMGISLI